MRYLQANVYRWSLRDCTNGGVTETSNVIYIANEQGPVTNPPAELCFIPEHRGGDYWALVHEHPIERGTKVVGPMFGGALAMTGDSRDNRIYRIHDRYESEAHARALSI